MAFTGSNAPNGLGNSPGNNSSKAWYQAGNDSFTSRTSLRQEAQAPSQKGRQRGGVHWPSWVILSSPSTLCSVICILSSSKWPYLRLLIRALCCTFHILAWQLAPISRAAMEHFS